MEEITPTKSDNSRYIVLSARRSRSNNDASPSWATILPSRIAFEPLSPFIAKSGHDESRTAGLLLARRVPTLYPRLMKNAAVNQNVTSH